MNDYELVPMKDDNIFALKLLTGEFKDIVYSYNRCTVEDNEDHATLSFEYDIIENIDNNYDVKQFEQYIGDILLNLIEKQLATNSIIYAGGVE